MKKLLIVVFALLFFYPFAFAKDNIEFVPAQQKDSDNFIDWDEEEYDNWLKKGNIIVDLGTGVDFFTYGNRKIGLDNTAFLINVRAIYDITPVFALGMEMFYSPNNAKDGKPVPYYNEYYGNPNFSVEQNSNSYHTLSLMLASRFNLNPKSASRFYFSLAGGYMYLMQSTQYTAHSLLVPGESHKFIEKDYLSHGISGYGGLGWEYDVSSFVVGLESRFMIFRYDGEYVNGISLMMRFGYKL